MQRFLIGIKYNQRQVFYKYFSGANVKENRKLLAEMQIVSCFIEVNFILLLWYSLDIFYNGVAAVLIPHFYN